MNRRAKCFCNHGTRVVGRVYRPSVSDVLRLVSRERQAILRSYHRARAGAARTRPFGGGPAARPSVMRYTGPPERMFDPAQDRCGIVNRVLTYRGRHAVRIRRVSSATANTTAGLSTRLLERTQCVCFYFTCSGLRPALPANMTCAQCRRACAAFTTSITI